MLGDSPLHRALSLGYECECDPPSESTLYDDHFMAMKNELVHMGSRFSHHVATELKNRIHLTPTGENMSFP